MQHRCSKKSDVQSQHWKQHCVDFKISLLRQNIVSIFSSIPTCKSTIGYTLLCFHKFSIIWQQYLYLFKQSIHNLFPWFQALWNSSQYLLFCFCRLWTSPENTIYSIVSKYLTIFVFWWWASPQFTIFSKKNYILWNVKKR